MVFDYFGNVELNKNKIPSDSIMQNQFGAPKKIKKIEEKIERLEGKIVAIDDDMVAAGADVGRCIELQATKDELQRELDACYAEWEELEALIAA